MARAEEAATTPDLPPLEGDEDGTDSEDSEAEKVEEAEALARRLVLQELRAIVAVRDAAACSVGDVLKLVRARAPEEYRIVGKCGWSTRAPTASQEGGSSSRSHSAPTASGRLPYQPASLAPTHRPLCAPPLTRAVLPVLYVASECMGILWALYGKCTGTTCTYIQ